MHTNNVFYMMVGILLLSFVSVSCCMANNDDDTITVIDQRGKEVTIPSNVERIVVVPKPAASLLVTIDGTEERIVGMHPDVKSLVEEGNILGKIAPGLNDISTDFVKSGFEPNVEEILKLEPDVIIQWGDMGNDIIDPLEVTGIPTVGIVFGDFENTTMLYGKILGKEEQAAKLVDYHHNLHQEIMAVTSQIPEQDKPRVLSLYSGNQDQFSIVGFDWIELSGAINVADELSTYGDSANMEQIITWNPDIIYIFTSDDFTPEQVLNNDIEGQDWSSINAVKTGNVYAIPEGTHWWGPPNQEIPLMWEWLVEIQHPELFDYDVRQDLVNFYLEYFDYSLSDEEIDTILCCDMNQGASCCCA